MTRSFSALAMAWGSMLWLAAAAQAGVGDPQLRTDHPWYPGELACSTFERLQATQAALYERVVGAAPRDDHHRALAAWLWRNTHYWHGEEGAEDLWGQGFTAGGDRVTREYWTGLFAHGFALCGTTHAQWTAEMQALLGHNRGRSVGTAGHNSFEVFLTGGPYGDGKWVLLDHDLSTVIFNREGTALLSIAEVVRDHRRLASRQFLPERQGGWLVCGLHPDDGGVYAQYHTAEYFAGYSGPPPSVHLRRGESLRRYLEPGLEDGQTFVFWGRNYGTGGVPGPERAHTWVNQPDKMHGSRDGAGYRPGQARFANAVYVYTPDFTADDYREGVLDESAAHVTFEFQTPYIIAATPPNDRPWGIYDAGGRHGLVVEGRADCTVSLSTDRGLSWSEPAPLAGRVDLTDLAKGRRQYWLRFSAGAAALRSAGVRITTVCQANSSVLPRLTDHGSTVEFQASGRALVSAGPNRPQAQPHVVAGGFDSPTVTLELAAPRGAPAVAVYAAAHVRSSNPPREEIAYAIDYSLDRGGSWRPLVADWRITRRGDEPAQFWSQSFCWGDTQLSPAAAGPVQVRWRNTGGKQYARAELHLAYEPPQADGVEVEFAWSDATGDRRHTHVVTSEAARQGATWTVPTGGGVRTRWVEFRPRAN